MSATTSSTPKANGRVRTWLKWVLVAVLLLANVAAFGVYWSLRNVQRSFAASATTAGPEVVQQLTPAPTSKSEPVTVLLIGSDSRAGLKDLKNFGTAPGQRADVIMLIRLYPNTDRAEILSIPRDLYVSIPGKGKDRINAAYAFGGAPLIVKTVTEVTGIPINHYVEVDFTGFQAIVDQVGGVQISFPYPARDLNSGLNVQAGLQTLDGTQALAYARSRHYQEYRNGQWVSVDASDIGRTHRQQQLIFAILAKLKSPSTITKIGPLVTTFGKYLTVDPAWANGSALDLAMKMRGLSASSIDSATLPTNPLNLDGKSMLSMKEPDASEMLARFKAGEPLTATTTTRVLVLNGNGVPGIAAQVTSKLKASGFTTLPPTDAARKDYAQTLIIVPAGRESEGKAIARALGYGTVTTGTVNPGTDAMIIVGRDVSAG